jgi:chemotaxis protein histidine kinase CheA
MIIQARIRGSICRDSAQLIEAFALQEQHKSAARIQAMIRGFIARESAFYEDAAATMIQAHVRRRTAEARVAALQQQRRSELRARAKAGREAREHFKEEAAKRAAEQAEEQARKKAEEKKMRKIAEAEERARKQAEIVAAEHFKQAQLQRQQEQQQEERQARLWRVKVQIISATKLAKVGLFGKSDPYAVLHVLPASNCDWTNSPPELKTGGLEKSVRDEGGTVLGKTNVVKKSLAPEWDSSRNSFVGDTPAEDGAMVIEVWDAGDTFLGEAVIKGARVAEMLAKQDRHELTKLLKAKPGKEKKWSK